MGGRLLGSSNQFRKGAARAQGPGWFTEIATDPHQTLLQGGPVGKVTTGLTHQPLSNLSEDCIFLGGGPAEIATLDFSDKTLVFSGQRAGKQPGEDDVDRQVGDSTITEQRLGLGATGRTKGPVPFPE